MNPINRCPGSQQIPDNTIPFNAARDLYWLPAECHHCGAIVKVRQGQGTLYVHKSAPVAEEQTMDSKLQLARQCAGEYTGTIVDAHGETVYLRINKVPRGYYAGVEYTGIRGGYTSPAGWYWIVDTGTLYERAELPFTTYAQCLASLQYNLPFIVTLPSDIAVTATSPSPEADSPADTSRALAGLTTNSRIALDAAVNIAPLSEENRGYLTVLADQLDSARNRYVRQYGPTQEHWYAGSIVAGLRDMVEASAPYTTVEACIGRALADLARVDTGTARILEEVVYQYAGAIGYGRDSHLLWPYVSIIRSHIPAPALTIP